ncbi:hypothetical protein Mgra_00009104, partial [Meloidogyne graminicola]
TSINERFTLLILSTATAITLTTFIWLTLKNINQKKKRIREYIRAGTVNELYLYPIKSCKANKVEWIDCKKRGASNGEEFDRHFLVFK